MVKCYYVGNNGFFIRVFCEDICKGKGCVFRIKMEVRNVEFRRFIFYFFVRNLIIGNK